MYVWHGSDVADIVGLLAYYSITHQNTSWIQFNLLMPHTIFHNYSSQKVVFSHWMLAVLIRKATQIIRKFGPVNWCRSYKILLQLMRECVVRVKTKIPLPSKSFVSIGVNVLLYKMLRCISNVWLLFFLLLLFISLSFFLARVVPIVCLDVFLIVLGRMARTVACYVCMSVREITHLRFLLK